MIDTPQLVQTQDQLTAYIPMTVPRSEIREVMGPGLREIMEVLAEQGVQPTGPWFTHHRRMDPEVFDFEIGMPVAATIRPVGRVKAGRMPAQKVARTIFRGDYEGLGEAWEAFMGWIDGQGLTPAENLWEIYARGPESSEDPAGWETVLNRPVVG